MSLRLYTACAVAVTISALAGLLVGGWIASDSGETPLTVSHTVSEPPAAGGMGAPRP